MVLESQSTPPKSLNSSPSFRRILNLLPAITKDLGREGGFDLLVATYGDTPPIWSN
jgi:hypothetical protein